MEAIKRSIDARSANPYPTSAHFSPRPTIFRNLNDHTTFWPISIVRRQHATIFLTLGKVQSGPEIELALQQPKLNFALVLLAEDSPKEIFRQILVACTMHLVTINRLNSIARAVGQNLSRWWPGVAFLPLECVIFKSFSRFDCLFQAFVSGVEFSIFVIRI